MRLRRTVQAISFSAFLLLLWYAAFPLALPVPVDLFLRMDPLILMLTGAGLRGFLLKMFPAVIILGMSVFLGRFFCSMICPLGTSIDITDRLMRGGTVQAEAVSGGGLKQVKYLVLCFVLVSALAGLSLAAYGSPLALATRFYGMLVYPLVSLAADAGLAVLRPLADRAGIAVIAYADIPLRSFNLLWITVALMGGIAAGAFLAPRFWCRYLCPAGAILALTSWRPLLGRRRVGDGCTSCGLCSSSCPMEAIGQDPHTTDFSECIVCMKCAHVCPEKAVRFTPGKGSQQLRTGLLSQHRRALMLSALAGVATAMVSLSTLRGRACEGGPGQVMDPSLIRPPGSLPECGFLKACVGCGECMKTCPTNTLQPAGLAAGLAALFSPVMVPRRGPCDPACNACGRVCPTGAIRDLVLEEKRHAKVGTAHILRHTCIAWEAGKACLVCDEVCPYGAVSLQRAPGIAVMVPAVDESRCNGCGFCEHYCPVVPGAAIVVGPMDELRLESGSYRAKSRELGLSFEPKNQGDPPAIKDDGLPPGFSD
jgi:MauM/NapG family ferredoxin protein